MINELAKTSLCKGLSQAQLERLSELGHFQTIEKETVIVRENEEATHFFILIKGEVKVTKQTTDKKGKTKTHVLATLSQGAVMGEMSLIEDKPRSANLLSASSAVIVRFKIEDVKNELDIFSVISRNIAIDLSDRLRYTNDVTLKAMTNELNESKARVSMGIFIVSILWLVSTFSIALSLLKVVKQIVPSMALFSTVLIAVVAVSIFIMIIRHHFNLKSFGLTLENWRANTIEAILCSLPLLATYTGIKALLVFVISPHSDLSLFSPFSYFQKGDNTDLTLYITTWVAFVLLAPMQEFVARGALQSSFQRFLPGEGALKDWNTIILANLIFAMMLAHTDVRLALSSILPGLFWGWLYNKQKSLLGVCISHLIIGSWVLFILGMPNGFYFPIQLFS